jgi:hypothetical protein
MNKEYAPLMLEKPIYRAFSACSGDWGKQGCQKYKNWYFRQSSIERCRHPLRVKGFDRKKQSDCPDISITEFFMKSDPEIDLQCPGKVIGFYNASLTWVSPLAVLSVF